MLVIKLCKLKIKAIILKIEVITTQISYILNYFTVVGILLHSQSTAWWKYYQRED